MRKRLVDAVLVIALALLFMKLFGSVHFTPSMTDHLVRFAASFGRYGDEDVEDLFLLVATITSFVLSLLIVGIARFVSSRLAGESDRR